MINYAYLCALTNADAVVACVAILTLGYIVHLIIK